MGAKMEKKIWFEYLTGDRFWLQGHQPPSRNRLLLHSPELHPSRCHPMPSHRKGAVALRYPHCRGLIL
jgi:hypothetical protein